MRTTFRTTLLSGAATLLLAGSLLPAQTAQPKASLPTAGRLDVALTYGATTAGAVGGTAFWMQGGSAQVEGRFYRGLGVVADVSGAHVANIHSTGIGLDMVIATFGPRYTWSPAHARYALYGQALTGIANSFHTVIPTPAGAISSGDSLALKLGGGIVPPSRPTLPCASLRPTGSAPSSSTPPPMCRATSNSALAWWFTFGDSASRRLARFISFGPRTICSIHVVARHERSDMMLCAADHASLLQFRVDAHAIAGLMPARIHRARTDVFRLLRGAPYKATT